MPVCTSSSTGIDTLAIQCEVEVRSCIIVVSEKTVAVIVQAIEEVQTNSCTEPNIGIGALNTFSSVNLEPVHISALLKTPLSGFGLHVLLET